MEPQGPDQKEQEVNVFEPQPRLPVQTPVEPEPPKKKTNKLLLALVVFCFVLAVGATSAYLLQANNESATSNSQQTTAQGNTPTQEETNTENTKPAESVDTTFTSTLYPDLRFTVPKGWEVIEPTDYDESIKGPGSADGTIKVKSPDATLVLQLTTVGVMGFEGYSCRTYTDIVKVGDVYRFVTPEGELQYATGISESDYEWANVTGDNEFTVIETEDANYCINIPFIGIYSSTINQKDFPEQSYGMAENEKALVWLSVVLEGKRDEAILEDTDALITSLSPSVVDY